MRKFALVIPSVLLVFLAAPLESRDVTDDDSVLSAHALVTETRALQEAPTEEASEAESADEAAAEVEATETAAGEGADEAAMQEAEGMQEEAATEGADQSEWVWILGLAAAFIIVWLLLRKRKARREV